MKLSDRQRLFALYLYTLLVPYAYAKGYRVRVGDGYRDPRVFGHYGTRKGYGSARSLHKKRLAVDVILDKWDERRQRWVYCTATKDYQELGEFWESLHEDCQWGGSGNRRDGNHFSMRTRPGEW